MLLVVGYGATRAFRDEELRHATRDEEEGFEETGWQQLRYDVFRPPRNVALLSSCIGLGAQLVSVAVLLWLVGLLGGFADYRRNALRNASFFAYLFAAGPFASILRW